MRTCPYCGKRAIMSEVYDALFCEDCDIWLEKSCRELTEEEKDEMVKELMGELSGEDIQFTDSDEPCIYCSKRPERPSQAEMLNYPPREVEE